MIPYKYKKRKLRAICLRNLERQCSYFIRVWGKDNEFASFKSTCSGATINPTFEVKETDLGFCQSFLSLESCHLSPYP